MRVVVAPGQGSQTEGFLKLWMEEVKGFRELLVTYSEIVSLDLCELGTIASEDQIKDTAIAQPLIVAASLASYRTLLEDLTVDAVAGHSVGEFAAAAIAGVLTDQEALKLVSVRARAMARAAAEFETSMAAVIGGDEAEIFATLETLGLYPANFNGGGQLVVAGERKAIAELVESPPQRSRVIELKVAGAFHTKFMESAKAELKVAADELEPKNPKLTLFSNQAGQMVEKGSEFLALLVSQVSNPVRWDKVMANFEGKGAEVIELAPAGALSGLFKRAVQDCRTVPLKTPSDFEKVVK